MTIWALENLAVTREIMLRAASAEVNDDVAATFKEKLEVPSNLINLAGCQRMLLQKMAKEAGLYSLLLSMGCLGKNLHEYVPNPC